MPYGTVNADKMTTSDGVSSSGLYGFKNRLINSAMVIDQRNAGASVTPNNSYTLDRWQGQNSQSSKYTVQQNAGSVTPPSGFTNYLGVTSSSAYSIVAGDYFAIRQAVEGFNIADLGWGAASASSVTLSFWVRSSLTGTFGGSLQNNGNVRSYPFTYTISSANTWEQKTLTIAGDTSGTWATNSSVGIWVILGLGVGSTYSGTASSWSTNNYISATGATSVVGTNGATFYLTGVQLEKGSTATSFDYRPYGTELQLCQRYYSVYQDFYFRTYQVALVYFGGSMTLAVNMRSTPTMAIVGTPSYANSSGMVVVANQGTSVFLMYALTSASAGDSRFSCSGPSNYLTASAEL